MPTITEQYQATCDERHKNVVTTKQVLSWVLGILTGLFAAGVAAGAANMRLSSVEEEQVQMQQSIVRLEGERERLSTKLELVVNDLAWQSQTLALIADKLDVAAPRR